MLTKEEIDEAIASASEETREMGWRLAMYAKMPSVKTSSTKEVYEMIWPNLAVLEEKLRRRFYIELWEKGMNGKN